MVSISYTKENVKDLRVSGGVHGEFNNCLNVAVSRWWIKKE
jgi:hypothetical protein